MLIYSRKQLKTRSKEQLRGNWGTVIGAFLLAALVPSIALSVPSGILSGIEAVAVEYDMLVFASLMNMLNGLITLAMTVLVIGPLSMGLVVFNLRFVRGHEVNYAMPYRVFSKGVYGRFTLAFFMMNLFIFLWSLLFLIPGIVKSYSYYMMPFLMADHPTMGWKDAIAESKRMMHGHKWDLFVLQLSFLGWVILVTITMGIAAIYVGPYMMMAEANFYRSLRNEQI